MADWKEFLIQTRLSEDLNSPASISEIMEAESFLKFSFPEELKNIYLHSNGQKGEKKGLFKAVSGYDVYKRPLFLSLKEMCSIWQRLAKDEDMREYFKSTYIPFASDDKVYPDNVFCLDTESGNVFLLWALAADFTLPADWQLAKIKQAENLSLFLDNQTLFYSI